MKQLIVVKVADILELVMIAKKAQVAAAIMYVFLMNQKSAISTVLRLKANQRFWIIKSRTFDINAIKNNFCLKN